MPKKDGKKGDKKPDPRKKLEAVADKALPEKAKRGVKSLREKYAGYKEGGLVTRDGPVTGAKNYMKNGKRCRR